MPTTSDYLAAIPNIPQAEAQGSSYVNGIYDQAAKLQAGSAFGAGDYTGASKALASRGDIPDAITAQNYGQTAAVKGQQYVAAALPVFKAVAAAHANDPDGGSAALGAAFDHIAPEAQAATGASTQQLQAFRQSLTTDPSGTIARLDAQVPIVDKTVGDDLLQFKGPNLIARYTGSKTVPAPAGTSLYQVGGTGGPVGPDGSIAQPAAQSPAASAAPVSGRPDALFGSSAVQPGAVSTVESAGNPNAVSHKGATGTMQTMPATLLDPGFGVTPAQNNSPAEQARVGTDYLSALQQHYGNPTLALVAYNMGPGATDAWLKGGGSFKDLPQETQNYLGHVAVAQATGQLSPVALGAPGGTNAPAQAATPANAPAAPGGARLIAAAAPVWRAPTPEEQKQYPGATQINANGEVKYPPVSALGASMTDAQVQPYVEILRSGGTLPQSLARNPALYTRILNVAQQEGISTSDFLANQGNRKATQQTFNQVNTRYAMVQTQEQAFQNSLNLAYSLAQKAGPQGGGTLVNGWKNWIKTGVVGDPQTGAFINAVNTAMNEYGKIIEGSTGNGGSSISAREDANQMLSGADNLPAFVAKMQVLQQDAGFKIGALKDQHDTLLGTLRSIGNDDATDASTSPATPLNLQPGSNYKGLPVLAPASALSYPSNKQFYSSDGRLFYGKGKPQ